MKLELVPTLHIQREFFSQPRGMERFWEYIGIITDGGDDIVTPIGSLNPMGREHNAAKVEELITFDAEGAAGEALAECEQRLASVPLALRLSLVVNDDLRGSWSNRITGELAKRLPPDKMDNWLKRGFVEIPYGMYANGAYPMLVPSETKNRIFVEVFDVDEGKVRELDALEEPYEYWRETAHLHEWGKDVAIYVHAAPPPEGFELVPSGEWR